MDRAPKVGQYWKDTYGNIFLIESYNSVQYCYYISYIDGKGLITSASILDEDHVRHYCKPAKYVNTPLWDVLNGEK